ncbi:MAG: hypothetical protein Tsb006_5860 [Rickettsiaceae bacterium]
MQSKNNRINKQKGLYIMFDFKDILVKQTMNKFLNVFAVMFIFTANNTAFSADTKITFFNGLLLNGQLTKSDKVGIDFGSGEVKFLINNSSTRLFEDFNADSSGQDHITEKAKIQNLISNLDKLGPEFIKKESKKKEAQSVEVNKSKITDNAIRSDIFKLVESTVHGSNPEIKIFATGDWRKIPSINGITTITAAEEQASTALSSIIDANPRDIYISGSVGFIDKEYGNAYFDTFKVNETLTKLDTILTSHTFSDADRKTNNGNLGRMLFILSELAKNGNTRARVTTGNSTVGFAFIDDFDTVLTKVGSHPDSFVTLGAVREDTNAPAALVTSKYSTKNTSDLANVPQNVLNVFGGSAEKFQIYASTVLLKYQFDRGATDLATLVSEMESMLNSYESNPQSLLDDFNNIVSTLTDKTSTVAVTRTIKVDVDKVDMLLDAAEENKRAQEFAKQNPQFNDSFDKLRFNSDARDFINSYFSMSSAKQQEASERVIPLNHHTAIIDSLAITASNNLNSSHRAIASRIDSLNSIFVSEENSATTGLSAGNEYSPVYGAWVSPFYTSSKQSSRKESSGYKSSSFGGTIGFDIAPRETTIIGLATTYLANNVSYKNQKAGDKAKINTTTLSLYGIEQINKNWFAQGVISFGINKVNNKEKRIINDTLSEIANGKYDLKSYGIEALGGYNHIVGDYLIVPQAGLRYTNIEGASYKETGTNRRNLVVSQKSSDKFEGIVGIRTSKEIKVDNATISPEVHGFLNYDFISKAPKVNAKLDGAANVLPTSSNKPSRVALNIGANITAYYSMMEYQLVYDAHIASKFTSNQISIKARLNF